MLYEYIIKNYKETEPIFYSDLPLFGKAKSELSRQLRILCEEGKLCKFDKSVYYIPKKSILSTAIGPSADVVARYKYISRRGKVDGYYTGNSLANRFGISTQIPMKPEIISNNMSAKFKEVEVGKMIFVVRKSTIKVTNENVKILQLLEMIKIVDEYMDGSYADAREKIKNYIISNDIRREDIDKYIRKYPLTIFKNYYEMGLDDVFA